MIEIELQDVVSNIDNSRESAPKLQGLGYGIVEPVEGSGKPSLFALALGAPDDKGRYCKLVEQYEEALVTLAGSISQQGQLSNCRVRPTGDGNYALIFGARRCLAVLLLHAKHGKPATVAATVSEANDRSAVMESAAENIHLPPSYMDQARLFKRLQDQGMTVNEIAKAFPMGKATEQNIRHRLRLLELPVEVQLKVHHGKLSQDAALKLLKNPDKDAGKPAKTPLTEPKPAYRPSENEPKDKGKPMRKKPEPQEEMADAKKNELQSALVEFVNRLKELDLETVVSGDPDELLRLTKEALRLLCSVEEKASKGALALVR